MADASKKKARKSKIEIREWTVDSDNDDIEMQVQPFKIHRSLPPVISRHTVKPSTSKALTYDNSILKKLSVEPEEQGIRNSPIKFDIKVEVETCDDDLQIIGDTETNEMPLHKELQELEAKTTDLTFLSIKLSHKNILEAADKIIKESPTLPNKMLDSCVRNVIELDIKGKPKKHDTLIQEALDEWKSWVSRSFHRDSPLFYKCYICDKSWWYLSDFHEHILKHNDVNVDMEPYEKYECNIIAFKGSKPRKIKEIYTKGLCYRCGKDYDSHKLSARAFKRFYMNEGCSKQFFTCIDLTRHVPVCSQCNIDTLVYKCDICSVCFDMEDLLADHYEYSHTVRSDIPIFVNYKSCKDCLSRYNCNDHHMCAKRVLYQRCAYCFRSFLSRNLLEMHMETSTKSYICEICNEDLLWNCLKYEHMMKHTDKYIFVSRCIRCDDLTVFLTNEGALRHKILVHNDTKAVKLQRYFPLMIVPKSCVYETKKALGLKYEVEQVQIPPPIQETVPKIETEIISEQPDSDDDRLIIKEEPVDIEEHALPEVTIKSEPLEETEELDEEFNMDDYIIIKQEKIEEEEEEDIYEDDIIKLNIDLPLTVKDEPIETLTFIDPDEPNQDSNSESVYLQKMLEPEVVIDKRKSQFNYSCKKCGFKAKHKEYKNHKDCHCPRSSSKSLTCTKCSEEFSSMKKFLSHYVDHGYKYRSCPDCLRVFYSFTKLTPHIQVHVRQLFARVKLITQDGSTTQRPEYRCKKCNIIVNPSEFFEHWETHISDTPPKVDDQQEQVTMSYPRMESDITEEMVRESIKLLKKTPKVCNQCDRAFKRINECKRHIIEHLLTDAYTQKYIHQGLRCQICSSSFPTRDKYKQHMRDHAALPLYKCELCDRTFGDSSNFTKHKKVHNLKVFVCDLCGKKFQSKNSLATHIERHKQNEPINCKLCNKVFFFENGYKKHLLYYHERVNLGYRCVICNKRFTSLKLKWNHMWEVHKERKHKADCPICLKSYRKYSDVRAHARNEHNVEVSVNSVKNAPHSFINADTYVSKASEPETLVVY